MTCRELIEFLMDYLDGELPAGERCRFDEHLALCADCRAYVRNYEATVRAGKIALAPCEDEVPESVPEQLVQAILTSRRKEV